MNKVWKGMILAGFLAAGLTSSGCSGGKPSAAAQAPAGAKAQQPGTLTLVYTYRPKASAWANQQAAWIENDRGQVVRTLLATRFTTQGGYRKRSMSIPVWVQRSGLAQMKSAQVDAVTGATPKAGEQRLVWDGKDDSGRPLPDGTYRVFLEATLYKYSDLLVQGSFIKGGTDQNVKMEARLEREPEQAENRDMVSNVEAFYKGATH